jgi:hypothetical protein
MFLLGGVMNAEQNSESDAASIAPEAPGSQVINEMTGRVRQQKKEANRSLPF